MSRARHNRASGGGTPIKASLGNPNVYKEAEDKKKGGKVKRATGGAVAGVAAAPVTKTIGRMSGGAVKARLDRPGRKKGGRVGSNNAPLSTANAVVSAPKLPATNGAN